MTNSNNNKDDDLIREFVDLQERLKEWIINHARKRGVTSDTLTMDLMLNNSGQFDGSVLHTELHYKIIPPDTFTFTSTQTSESQTSELGENDGR